jgi:hypothetical protein
VAIRGTKQSVRRRDGRAAATCRAYAQCDYRNGIFC